MLLDMETIWKAVTYLLEYVIQTTFEIKFMDTMHHMWI